MESSKALNPRDGVISELMQGRELAKQLQNHLDPSTPHETRDFLIQKILSTYSKLLQITNPSGSYSSLPMDQSSHQISFHGMTATHSPCSGSHCPDVDDGGRPSKRRKNSPKWVKKVEVRVEGGEERNLCDGYNWRKYGQKAILGAKFPRGYYRCSHLHTRGCGATKHVQKSDEDPSMFHVIYRGHHTCSPQPIIIYTHSDDAHQVQVPAPHQDTQPRLLKVEEDDSDIFSAFLGDFFSAPDSPKAAFEFLLDDPALQHNFSLHQQQPEFMFGSYTDQNNPYPMS